MQIGISSTVVHFIIILKADGNKTTEILILADITLNNQLPVFTVHITEVKHKNNNRSNEMKHKKATDIIK